MTFTFPQPVILSAFLLTSVSGVIVNMHAGAYIYSETECACVCKCLYLCLLIQMYVFAQDAMQACVPLVLIRVCQRYFLAVFRCRSLVWFVFSSYTPPMQPLEMKR